MASKFAKHALLDIAQGMGKKKTEEELRAERFAPKDEEIVRENVLEKAAQKLQAERGVANNTKVTNAAKSANAAMKDTYLKDRETVNSRNKQLSQVAYENYLYKQTKGKDTPSARQIAEQGAYAFMPDAREQEYASRIDALKKNGAANTAMERMMQTEEKNPAIKGTTQKLYDLLNERKQVVYPTSDAAQLRGLAQQYSDKAATYDTGTERGAMLANMAQTVADEYNRQAGIVENPKAALEEVNAQIAQLENAQKVGSYWQKGQGKNQMNAKLGELYKQRDLLEAATSGKDTFMRRNLMAFTDVPQSTLEGQTNEDVRKQLPPADVQSLLVAGVPEGMELKDYNPDTILRDVQLDKESYNIYRDLVDTNQLDKAEAFMAAMQDKVNRENQEDMLGFYDYMAKDSIAGNVAANIAGTSAQILTPVAGAKSIIRNMQGKTMDAYDPVFYPGRLNAQVMQSTHEALGDLIENEKWEDAAVFVYDAVKSVADNFTRTFAQHAMGVGALGRTASMGLSAYGDAVMGVAEKGGTVEQQIALGTISAASEILTELLPESLMQGILDNMGTGTWGKVIDAALSALFADAPGEMINTVGTSAAEETIMREKGNVTKMAEQLMVSGEAESMDEARTMAWKSVFRNALYDGFVAMVSAGAMQGGTEVVSTLQNYSTKAKLEALAKEQTEAETNAQQPAQEQAAEAVETMEQQEETLSDIASTMVANEKPASKVTVRTAQEVAAERASAAQAEKAQEVKTAPAKVRQDAPKVEATDDGYTVEKNGQSVNMDEMDADDVDARMLNKAQGMSTEAANDMLGGYDKEAGVDADMYAKGYKQAYDAGVQGKGLDKVKTLYAEDMTDEQLKRAYELGAQEREKEQANILRKTELYAAQAGIKVRQAPGTAGVSAERITRKLTDREKITMQLLDRFGKKFDLQFRIYDTLDEGRSNATYIEGTNVINVALDAQKGALNRAASHEAFHYVEKFAKEDADKLKAFVLNKLRNMEEYDLDARIREKEAQYKAAGIENFDAESEIVADSMLDIIGTEENIRQMAQENPNLLSKICDAVQRISDFLQEQLEALSLINKEAGALYGDKEYMDEVVRRMNKALENAKENRQAQQRVSQTAAMDADVQAYLKDLSTAKDAQERANLLESLTNQVYLRTQMDMIQKTGDYEGGMQPFKDALNDFAKGKGNLNTLLKDAGLDAAKNEQDTAVMAWLARERERVGAGAMVQNSIKDNDAFEKWFADSPFKNADGTPKVYYHGTPYGGFDTFKGWSYFTADKAYADKYHNPSASSIRGKYNAATKPETYEVYLTADKVFDTRDPKVRKVWREQFYDHYSRTPLTDRGVPDWTDGIDLIEFIEENDMDYDAIILDEGGTGGYGDNVQDRGLSVVVKDSSQVKSVNNVGTYDKNTGNIYRSLKDTEDVQGMRDELQALEEEQKQLQQEQERYKATEEYKRVHEPFMAKEEGARKAYAEYLKRSGLGKVNKRMNEVRNMIFSLESKIANAELEAQVQKVEDPVRKAARLRNELGEMEMRLQEVTTKLNEMQKGKGYNDIVDAMMAGTANDDAYNQYLESSGMMKLAKEEKQLRAEIADAKRQLEEAQKQNERQTEKTETPAFRKWFGKSQVVNDDGSPKMVYHGSSAEFDEFSYEFIGKHGSAEGQGIYFTDSVQMASGYTDGYGGKLYAGWLKIENPLSNDKKTMTRAKLKKLISMIDTGGDGIISGYARNTSDYGKPSFYQRELETTANAVYAGNANDAEMIAEIANGSGGMAYVAPYLRKLGYDGYVVKGKYTDATVYVAFESNQFKSVENAGTFDESTGNFYRSLKDEEMVNILAEITTDEEVRDAGKLINRLDEMRRQQGVTKGAWSGKTSELSKKILQDTSSRMGQAALTKQINALYRAMDEGDVTPRQLMEYAYDVAAKVAEGASVAQDVDEGVKSARDYIRNTTIYLNEDMQSEIRAKYGNLQTFMRNYFGRARFTTDSRKTSLEDMWDELCDMAPGYFKRDAVASEMPAVLETFLDATGKVARDYYGANETQLKQDVAMRLFWEYYKMPGTYRDLLDKQKEMVTQLHDTWEGLRDTFEQRVRERVENYKESEERQRQRNMLEKSVNAMKKRLLKPTKQQHIPEEMRGAVASMLELVNTSGNRSGQKTRTDAYKALKDAITELRKTDVGYAYVDPDLEVYLKELQEKSAGKSIMGMSLQELKDMNKVVRGIRHACTVADQLITEGHKGSVSVLADDAKAQLDRMADRKVRSDLANMVSSVGKYAFEDAPRFFRDLARYTGKAGENLWNIVRHGGLDKQITLLKEADDKMAEIRSRYTGYEKWMSRNSISKSFVTDSGTIELTTGQIMALYLLNKREQARNHIYGVKGTDGGIAQKRVQTKDGARESVRPHKVTEDQVNKIIGTLTKEQKAFADEMGALLSGWCADLGNEVSMNMYGYKKFTEKNYFPIEVWSGRKDATSGEEQQNQLYLIMNKGFTKELTDKAQAPLVIPDMFDAVTEHVNGMIVYNAWTAPVTDMIKFINYKFRDDSMTMDQNGNEVFAPGQNIIGTVKEDLSRVMGNGAEGWYVQLIKDINGLAKNKTEKAVSGFINKLTRNFKATAVGYNIGTMLKQPTSVIRAFDVIPPQYFVGKMVMPNKERQAIMEKYAPIVTWKGYGNFTMDTGKSIERILFPESSTKMERFNEWGMAGAGFMDTVTWHNIWMAAERMAAKQNPNLQRGTDALYKKTAEIFNQCIDQTQTVDSILHRNEFMRQDTAWIKSVTTFMGEPMKSYNMLLDAVNAWKTQSTKERAMKVSKEAGIFAANAVTAAFVSSMISALRNWDDEEPFWDQVWGKMFGEYDEDMTAGEKIREAIFGGNLAGELNILNYIPVARDIVETVAGYDVERVDMSLFADVRDAVEALKNEKTATPEKIMDLVGALGNFLGIPVNNIVSECKRIWNYGNRQLEAFGVDTLDSQYAFLRAQKRIGASANMTDYANLMLKAEEARRDDLVAEIRKDMLAVGTEESDIDSKMYKLQVEDLTGMKASKVSYEKTYAALGAAIKVGDKELQAALEKELKRAGRTDEQIANGLIDWLKTDERVISAAEKAVKGDTTEKVQLVKTLRAEGYSDEVAKKAINQLQNKMVTDAKASAGTQEEKKSEPKYEALYTNYDLQTAIESGSGVSDIISDLRKQGKSDTSIKSSLTSSIKPIYVALMKGTASDKAKAKQIKERLLKLDLENKYTEKAIDSWLE